MSEKQKLDADIILSSYWRGNAQFADFFNAVLFDGREVITPKSEWLSGMRKKDKFMPVVTIVVYYGEEPWDAALSLCGMLDIPDSIKGIVNDYKIRLVVI